MVGEVASVVGEGEEGAMPVVYLLILFFSYLFYAGKKRNVQEM